MHVSIRAAALAAICLGTGYAASSANASALLYEPFAYDPATGPGALPGKSPDGTHTWVEAYNNASAADDAAVVSSSLTSPTNLPASTGNRLQYGGTGRSYRIGFGGNGNPTSVTDGTIYYSMLLNITSLNRGAGTSAVLPGTGRQIATFSNGSSATTSSNLSVGFGPLWGVLAPDTTPGQSNTNQLYYLGVSKTQGTNARVFDTNHVYGPNDTVLVVVAYHRDAANEDYAELWVNPDSSTLGTPNQPPSLVSSALGTADGDPASNQVLSGFGLYQNSTLSTNTFGATGLNLDEVRVATTWQ